MCIKDKIREELRRNYGEFNTHLERIYENKITDLLVSGSKQDREAWLTYNQVILELKHSIKDNLRVKELQYHLTDNTNPKDICIEIIQKLEHPSPELERLYYKIKNFM